MVCQMLLPIVSICSTRSPSVFCLLRRAQSDRRTYFGRRVWFTESYTVLVIFFFTYCFIYSFFLDIKKVMLYPVRQGNHFLLK